MDGLAKSWREFASLKSRLYVSFMCKVILVTDVKTSKDVHSSFQKLSHMNEEAIYENKRHWLIETIDVIWRVRGKCFKTFEKEKESAAKTSHIIVAWDRCT